MKMRHFQFVIFLGYILSGFYFVSAQTQRPSPTIVATEPGVFVTFEGFGKRTPIREGESDNGIWLRMHNNMRFSISFCIYGLSEKSRLPVKPEANTQIGLYYDVILNARALDDDRPLPNIPIGYPIVGACQNYELQSGSSLLFAVPREHLADELSIKIQFNYEWEKTTENNPSHLVFFNSTNIPKTGSRPSK